MAGKLIPIAEYAKKHGVKPDTIRQRCIRGTMESAKKIGRDWLVPEDTPYIDHRISSRKYLNARNKGKITNK